jgi:hypothetical protein
MSVISSIQNSKEDLDKPKNKSYWSFDFDISLVEANYFRNKNNPSPTEKRMLGFDLSKEEHIEEVVVLNNGKKGLGRFTTEQVKEILSDMGFNVYPTFGGKHLADIEAIMNVGGYSVPGWVRIARTIAKFLPSREKLLVTKLSPGKDRLHVIAYEENDGSWAFASHTDFNWLSLNLPKIYQAHVGHGAGDYITGTLMFYELLTAFGKKTSENKILSVKEIENIIQDAYNKSLAKKLSFNSFSNIALS